MIVSGQIRSILPSFRKNTSIFPGQSFGHPARAPGKGVRLWGVEVCEAMRSASVQVALYAILSRFPLLRFARGGQKALLLRAIDGYRLTEKHWRPELRSEGTTGGIYRFRQLRRARCGELDP